MPNDPSAAYGPAAQAGSGQARAGAVTRQALLKGLEQIRERFHRQLDALETLARERAQASPEELVEREEQLRKRAHELEAARVQLEKDADRWHRERQAMIDKIDHDRRLLAEAWERLEREQVQQASAQPEAEALAPVAKPAPWPQAPATTISTESQHPVAEEILRQFHSLRRDVRRNAEGRCAVNS